MLMLTFEPMRCSCGQHDLVDEGHPFETCHFCGHATNSRPYVDWIWGKLYFAICHECTQIVRYEEWSISVHVAPEDLLARVAAYRGEPHHPPRLA